MPRLNAQEVIAAQKVSQAVANIHRMHQVAHGRFGEDLTASLHRLELELGHARRKQETPSPARPEVSTARSVTATEARAAGAHCATPER